jgi:hypothetical protein
VFGANCAITKSTENLFKKGLDKKKTAPCTAASESDYKRSEMKKQGSETPRSKDKVTAGSSTNLAKAGKASGAKERTSLTNKNAKLGNDTNATNKDPVK